MTSKERVLAAFHQTEPDRVPINYSANPGINARLLAHFGLEPSDGGGLAAALGVDFRGVGAPYVGPRLHAEVPDRHVDAIWGHHCRWVEHDSGGYWDYCDFPLKGADPEMVDAWPVPSPDDFDYSHVAEACKVNSEFAVHVGGAGTGDIINSTGFVCGMEDVLVALALDDEAILAHIDRRMGVLLEVTRRTIEAADGGIDFMWMGEDLGTQKSPMISLEMFRKHIRPRHQKFIDLAKAHGLPVMIHTCGSSSWAYEDYIEMGMTGVDTLQPEAANMSPKYLKEHFGGRLAFHGCISTAGPVAYGSVDDVIADCRETLETMMPGGGYMFAPTHSLQDNSPTENVVAMYECAKEYGRY
jgi:uroporphyrinogen decarboxylase